MQRHDANSRPLEPLERFCPLADIRNSDHGFFVLRKAGSAEDCIMKRKRIRHTASFEERLAMQAQRLKEQAQTLPPGNDREMLLKRVQQTETACRINAWLTSPGLRSPE
jgi:hypothetical protein